MTLRDQRRVYGATAQRRNGATAQRPDGRTLSSFPVTFPRLLVLEPRSDSPNNHGQSLEAGDSKLERRGAKPQL